MNVAKQTGPSVLELPWFKTARTMMAVHRLVLLIGEPGVGKTTFAVDAARRATGRDPLVLPGSPETEDRHIFGSYSLIGDETRFVDGPLIRALKAGGWLLVEEFSQIPLETRMAFLGLRGMDVLTNPLNGEAVPIPASFRLVGTSNPESMACRRNSGIARALYDDFLILDVPPPATAMVERFLRHHFPDADSDRVRRVLEMWQDYREIAEKREDDEPEHILSYRAAAHLMKLLLAGMEPDTAARVALANKYMTDPDLYAAAKLKSTLS